MEALSGFSFFSLLLLLIGEFSPLLLCFSFFSLLHISAIEYKYVLRFSFFSLLHENDEYPAVGILF